MNAGFLIKWKTPIQIKALLARSLKARGPTSLSGWAAKILAIFEEVSKPPEDSVEKHFRSCFTEADHAAQWFSLVPTLASGEELPVWHGFFSRERCYLKAQPGLSRTLFLELLNIAKSKGAQAVLMAVYRDPDAFMRLAKTLLCLGFKQVSLQEQAQLCTGPAVLFERKLT